MKTIYKRILKISSTVVLLFLFALASKATIQIVTVQNFSFSPSSFTVNLGDTVKWVWVDGGHTTTSTSIPAGATSWDSQINSGNTTFKYVPSVVGTYNYHCAIHPTTMIGSFSVVCATPDISISADGPKTFCSGGSVTLSQSAGGNFTSYQWQNNGSNIAGATNNSLTVTKKGDYTLVVTNSCGAQNTSNSINVTVNKLPKADVTPSGPITICPPQTVTLSVTTTSGATYQWYKNNNPIAGATNPTLDVSKAGNYTVTVIKTSTGCSKTSKKVVVSSACKDESVNPLTETIGYPNPTSDFMNLNIQSLDHPDVINVYDLSGKLITSYQVINTEIKVGENLLPGIYLVKIEKNNTVLQTVKLVKTK
ncbi:MAG: T9SS type A sorting domain-containing protein [Chitinophagales bacterium]|nr:T9SS type A sorting domain-containing protein [Chitinophagales bacterium]